MDAKTQERINKLLAMALSAGEHEASAALSRIRAVLEAQGVHPTDVRVGPGAGAQSQHYASFGVDLMLELTRLRVEAQTLRGDKQRLAMEVMDLRRQLAEAPVRPPSGGPQTPGGGRSDYQAAESGRREYQPPRQGTIRARAEELLRRKRLGSNEPAWTYYEVMLAVQRDFPGARTSVSSLKWYESQMRNAGIDVPRRRK